MAVLSVPRPLQDRLGDAATESLVGMLQQFEADQEQQRAAQKEHLFDVLEERFLRHVVESEDRLRKELRAEMQAGFALQQEQISRLGTELGTVRAEIGNLRVEIRKETADIRKETADIRKEITVQTRWILVVFGAAAVLFPIIQRVMATLLP